LFALTFCSEGFAPTTSTVSGNQQPEVCAPAANASNITTTHIKNTIFKSLMDLPRL
jgi:hypothetical protein